MKICKLIDFIKSSHTYPWSYSLYVQYDQKLTPDLLSVALDPDDVDSDDIDEPTFAIENGYKYVISVQMVQSICKNIELQTKGDISDEIYMKAFLFYVDNDAYITL